MAEKIAKSGEKKARHGLDTFWGGPRGMLIVGAFWVVVLLSWAAFGDGLVQMGAEIFKKS